MDMLVGDARRFSLIVLLGLFLLALGVRGFRAYQEAIPNPDVVRFVELGEGLARAPVRAMRGEDYHPLHSAAGLAVQALIRPFFRDDRVAWLAALRAVGIVCGSFVGLEIVGLARALGARFWACVAAAVVWIFGRRTSYYGADGLSDMLFLALFGAAMLVALRGRWVRGARGSMRMAVFFGAGLLSGLAYLARPEGLAAVVIVTATMVITLVSPQGWPGRGKLLGRRRPGVGEVVAAVGAMVIGAAIPAVPYMVIIGAVTHKVSFSGGQALAVGDAPIAGLAALGRIAREVFETFGFGPWVVVALAVVIAPRFWGRPSLRLLIGVWVGLWLGVMYWLLSRKGYLDGRHTLPLILLLHGMFALALGELVRWRPFRQREARGLYGADLPVETGGPNAPLRSRLGWVVFFLAVVPGLIELVHVPRSDKIYLRVAADWIAANTQDEVVVCDELQVVGFCAGHRYARWTGTAETPRLEDLEAVRSRFAENGVRPCLILGKSYSKGQRVVEGVGPYRVLASFSTAGGTSAESYVLYFLPGDAVLQRGAATQSTGVAGSRGNWRLASVQEVVPEDVGGAGRILAWGGVESDEHAQSTEHGTRH